MSDACCVHHDRLDTVLTSSEYLDFPCGTPTMPRGEPRYCCRACPSHGRPFVIKAAYAANPNLLPFLTEAEQAEAFQLALAAGPTGVAIVTETPPQPANAEDR